MRRTKAFHVPPANADLQIQAQFDHSAVPVHDIPLSATRAPRQAQLGASLRLANPAMDTLTIEFHHLSLRLLGGRGRRVLDSVSGALLPGTMTGILGRSGCGKTVFLTLLAGQTGRGGKIGGSVKINGKQLPIENFRALLGFVTQEDTMIRNLTVRQILEFSARMRLPYSMHDNEKMQIVDSILTVLDLVAVQHQPIGDEFTRGISGGQRKRVNVGIEMVAAPLALFLDEPTTGLDSASAYETMSSLTELLPLNVNIVATVHQPSLRLFNLFDRLLILGKGGVVFYSGRRELAVPYFQAAGYTFDPSLNPADEIVEILSGEKKPEDRPENLSLAETWQRFSIRQRKQNEMPSLDSSESLISLQSAMLEADQRADLHTSSKSPLDEYVSDTIDFSLLYRLAFFWSIGVSAMGALVCILLLAIPFTGNYFSYQYVVVPWCTLGLAFYLALIIFTVVTYICYPERRLLMENLLYFSLGSTFGPIAIIVAVPIQLYRHRSRFYFYWHFLNAGFGVWVLIVCSALGTFVALEENDFSLALDSFNFTNDVAVCWLFFVFVPFGFVVLVASILRIIRRTASTARLHASFIQQFSLQFERAVQQVFVDPSGLLSDFLLAAIAGILIGLVSSGRWSMPVLEILGQMTAGLPIAITDCFPSFPELLCKLVSVPQSDPLWKLALFIPLAVGLIGVISSLRHFGTAKATFRREYFASASTTALFLARNTILLLITAVSSGIFLSFWGWFTQPPGSAFIYFLFLWLVFFTSTSLGILCSVSLRLDLAGMIGILAVLVCTLFSTNLSGQGNFQQIVSFFSYINWSTVGFFFSFFYILVLIRSTGCFLHDKHGQL